MKTINYKGFLVFALSVLATGLTAENASAQRPSRGGSSNNTTPPKTSQAAPAPQRSVRLAPSRGTVSPSRTPNSTRQPSALAPSNNRVSQLPNGVRPSRSGYVNNGRFGYRPNPNYRPSYGYYRGYNYRSYGFNNRGYYGYYNYYRPFIGFRLSVLPYGYYPFYFGSDQYYYSGGLFYRQYENNYQVVIPPVGAEVQNIPSDASLTTIDGVNYYEYKGVYYTKGVNVNGKSVYMVAGKDGVLNTSNGPIDTHQIGDMINELPEGSREVVIKNEKYFVSPDEVYYEEVIDGAKVSYRVIGKL